MSYVARPCRPLFAALLVGAAGLSACELEPERLSPYAEVELVLDTDVDVRALAARLQIDLYDADERWFFSRELQREDPRTWPSSFVLVGPRTIDADAQPTTVLVRLRLYPDGKVRDYRGERFFEPGFLDDEEPGTCLPLLPPEYGAREAKQLEGFDPEGNPRPPYAPANEPLPDLAIDRIVPVRIVPGVQGQVRVLLSGDCLGKQAGFGATAAPGDERVCIDGAYTTAAVERADTRRPLDSTRAGTFPGARPCTAPPRQGAFHSFEDEVCVDGGLFVLGDPAVFAYGSFDAVPEQAVVLGPMRVDKFEVTVGRFRRALEDGLLEGVERPVANEGALDFASDDATRGCTYSEAALGREAYPLNCVSWETARAFCRAQGGDLPSEAQWEYTAAAAGRGGRETRFAWGSDEPTCDRAIFARAASPSTGATRCALEPIDVGPQPLHENEATSGDRTALGVVGMGGSVREHTLDAYHPYCARCWFEAPLVEPVCEPEAAALHTVRGGDWSSGDDTLLVGLRDEGLAPDAWSTRVGFRCVRSGNDDTDETGGTTP